MRKIWTLLLLFGLTAGWAADAVKPPEPAAPEAPAPNAVKPPRRRGMGSLYWRVFNRMSQEERRAMMELQAKDPAAFQEKMKKLAGELRAADEARRKQIEALAERARTGTDAEKKAAREELTKIFREGFQQRLTDSRRHLEEMRRRIEQLSEELKQREANADEMIRTMVDRCVQGIKPEPPHKHRGPGFPPPGPR